jgi:4-hydroxy-4-methyl-2-oxoglutarate aldolase
MLHEASGRHGSLGPEICPAWPGARLAGRCRTVRAAAGDNLAAHYAIERTQPGEVICLAAPAGALFAVWGEITTSSAQQRGAAGLVTSCAVRDVGVIESLGFPVFAAATTIQGTIKHNRGAHDVPIRIGRALILPGDWIVADADGCVVIPADRLADIAETAERKVTIETRVLAEIEVGASSRQALGLP